MTNFLNWTGCPRVGEDEKFFIALMSPDGPTNEHMHSVATALLSLSEGGLGYNFQVCTHTGNCHVDDARNALVAQFLQSDCTHLVFIDSDILFDDRALAQLLACPEDVCGASYRFKADVVGYPALITDMSYNDERDYVSVDGLPTGFMKIARSVFEKLDVPHYYAKQLVGVKIGEYFRRDIVDGVRFGGDINFCRLWREVGGQCWLVPKIVLGHTGQRTWEGCPWFYFSCISKGVWPSVRDAIKEDRWENEEVLARAMHQWGGNFTSPSLIEAVMHTLKSAPPGEVLELGSGLTTVFMSATGRLITSLEEDRMFLGKTWGVLDDFGPEYCNSVELVHAQVKDSSYQVKKEIWDKEYAFCLVDGPVMRTEDHHRKDALKVNAKVFLVDDAQRPHSLEVLEGLEERGYTISMLPIPDRFIAVATQ